METRIFSGANRNLLILAIVLCVGLFPISRDVSAGQGALDGKTFTVETGEKGKSGGDKDTLTFKDGNIRSAGCDQYGFGDGAYTSSVQGDSIQFEAVTTSTTKGKMTWKGTCATTAKRSKRFGNGILLSIKLLLNPAQPARKRGQTDVT